VIGDVLVFNMQGKTVLLDLRAMVQYQDCFHGGGAGS
jgi:hypothetical protein